jgi:transcriptional regulator with XRE-family HTH domain
LETKGAEGDGLAARLEKLFDVMHKPNTSPLSNDAVAAAIAEKTGVLINPAYLEQLRDGSETNPPVAHLKAIAEFSGLPASYLTDRNLDPRLDAQLTLLKAMRDNGVRDAALCRSELSPEALNRLAAIIASLPAHR